MNFDDIFGPCEPAGRPISAPEFAHKPDSLQALDAETARILKAYLETVDGLNLPKVLHTHCTVLWLIDEAGQVIFAAEELVDLSKGVSVAVRPKGNWGEIAGTAKLGHPSLLTGSAKRARIGGEILFNRTVARWEINNASGRYGMRAHQTPYHLDNAAGIFAGFEINLFPVFYRPRVRNAT